MTQQILSVFLTKNTKSTKKKKKSSMYIETFFTMAQIGNSLVYI